MKIVKFNKSRVNEWVKISSKSDDFNILSNPKFFEGLTCPYDLLVLQDKEKPILSAVIFKKQKKFSKYFLQDFNYNQGIYFLKKKNEKIIKSVEFFLNYLTNNYDDLRFSLNYSFKDLRAFQWYNYPNNEFNFNIVYSSIINLNEFKYFQQYLKKIRYSRRRENNLFSKSEYNIHKSNDILTFIKLYKKKYKNIIEDFVIKTHCKIIKNSSKKGFTRLNFIKKKNKIFGGSIFYFDKKSAYYAFSFINKNKEKFSLTTPLIIEQLNYFFNNRIKFFDMMGVNSPGRGDYKESFGGNLASFYEVIYKKKA